MVSKAIVANAPGGPLKVHGVMAYYGWTVSKAPPIDPSHLYGRRRP
jgi:hypothetical protein